tara:strand:+ start:358 stop:756 length:399 start_codon:yes stop_codon:yes gene_type:complete
MIKKILKVIAALLVTLVLLFVVVAKFSAIESRYECKGTIISNGITRPTLVYIKLNEYRWWVGLWSDSDGSLNLEVPNEFVDYFGHLKEVGDLLQIFDHSKNLVGSYSRLSGTLALQTDLGFIDGTCVKIEKR